MTGVVRIGNCSGFYGDRLSAMREMLEGGELDVLTGDYLAELTMLILGKDQLKDPSLGYARTFVRQLEDCLGLALERGVRIVANAGGLNPAGLADKVREVARGLGLDPQVAHVEGDDVRHLASRDGWEGALTANAYLGGFGIAAALTAGADVVVTGRVTDASLVVGPAIAHHGWGTTAYDELAGAVVAGHVIECGTQATGGNFSGFLELPHRDRPLGFPVAEVAADGSSVITKHAGTGGAVTVDTVTAQLVYEIQSTRYLGPDVTVHLDSVRLEQQAEDRVAIAGVVGEAPPERLKVCVNELGGWRNSVELVLTGLDVEAKAAWVRDQLGPRLTAAEVTWSDVRVPPAGRGHPLRRLPRGVRRPRRRHAHRRPRRRPAGGRRRPGRVRLRRRGARRPPLALPGPSRHPHPPPAARHLRARALRRQGRRRQRGSLGRARRRPAGDVRRPGAVALQADVAARHPHAAARGRRPRRRGVAAAAPRGGQPRRPRPARRGRRGVDALRPAGQGAR
jgi:hypothetical protein